MSSLKRTATEDGSVSPPPIKRKAINGTTNAAVKNFFTPASKKAPVRDRITWSVRGGTCLHAEFAPSPSPDSTASNLDSAVTEPSTAPNPASPGKDDDGDHAKPVPSAKIAAFDLDSTLLSTKSGKTFATDSADWKWWHASVPGRLRELAARGYLLVVLSNQGGITLTPRAKLEGKRLADFKAKVGMMLEQVGVRARVYAATGRDGFRKPRVGMWRALLEDAGLDEGAVDLGESLFVGDAGGRVADEKRGWKKDFSCGDRDFAANVGIPFHTPEEFFLGEEARPFSRPFEPSRYLVEESPTSLQAAPSTAFTKKHPVELVLFVGSPGAGKSTFYSKQLAPQKYVRINQDTLKTREKCAKAAAQELEAGNSVAVDNTNRDRAVRAFWVELARRHTVPIRCVWFTAEATLCRHNDCVRALVAADAHAAGSAARLNPEARVKLPDSTFPAYAKAFQEPNVAEGFEDLTKVDFAFDGTEEDRRIWGKYWV